MVGGFRPDRHCRHKCLSSTEIELPGKSGSSDTDHPTDLCSAFRVYRGSAAVVRGADARICRGIGERTRLGKVPCGWDLGLLAVPRSGTTFLLRSIRTALESAW